MADVAMKTLVNIDVPDLRAAVDFYTAALGLHATRVIDGDVAELTGASSVLYLLQRPGGSGATPQAGQTRDYSRHWTPVHVDFVVPDVEAAAARALAAGAVQESERVDWMGSKCITFSDPFGHGFCLIEFEDGAYSHERDGPAE
jgi:catechol 2,3-dioxygenase-like lactoylglutathione lyase family enzyme